MDAVNALLTPTWNRLALNGTIVDLPQVTGAKGAVTFEVPHAAAWRVLDATGFEGTWAGFEAEARRMSAQRVTVRSTDDVDAAPAEDFAAAAKDALDVPAKNAIPRGAVDAALGDGAVAWITDVANASDTARAYAVAPYANADEPLVIRVKAVPASASAASVSVLVGEGAHVSIRLQADSPETGRGIAAVALRVVALDDAKVDIATLQTLDRSWTYLESIEVKAADNATVSTAQTYLGGSTSYTGYGAALQGFRSSCAVQTSYLGAENVLDMNFNVRHFGRQTKSNLLANGMLGKGADKALRATIDLIHGAKGAKGHELESVLIADEGAKNRSLPIILCDEDDVQGDHGATIGHVPTSQRYYLAAHGLNDEAVNALLLQASFEKAYVEAFDSRAAAAVDRLAAATLGRGVADLSDTFTESDEEGEE